MPDEDFIKKLIELEAQGSLVYTPLMIKLEDAADNAAERTNIARRYLPLALLSALQDLECLRDIMDVAKRYPDFMPEILTCAFRLRADKALESWIEYESDEYKGFILDLEKRYFEKA